MPLPACAPDFAARNCRPYGPRMRAGLCASEASFPSRMGSPPMRYDAAIIGAGPAGSAAARLLAQAGWRVALVEKSEFPRRKVCGEFISATTMPVLEACGVAQAFREAAGPPVTHIGAYAGETMLTAPGRADWGRA